MSYYRVCQNCGASLDPDEKCDCEKNDAVSAANTNNVKRKNTFVYHTRNAQERQYEMRCESCR